MNSARLDHPGGGGYNRDRGDSSGDSSVINIHSEVVNT